MRRDRLRDRSPGKGIGLAAAVTVLAAAVLVAGVLVVLRGDDDDREMETAGARSTTTPPAAAPLTTSTSTSDTQPATTAPPLPTTTTTGAAPTTTTTIPPAPTTAPSAPAPPPCASALDAIAQWPLRRRLAALVMVGVDPSGSGEARQVVDEHHVGGLFVRGATGLYTSGALQDLRAESPTGLMVSVDEEGGRVQSIEDLDGDVPSARDMAATMTPAEVTELARRRARVMAEHGITVDLAPVVDVSDQPDRTVIGDRSWSDDPQTVVAYAGAYADGLRLEGITPVLKHFPGHGSGSGDSHQGVTTTPSLDALRQRDLLPYDDLLPRLGTTTGVMLGHLDVPGLTEDGTPTSLSPATVRLLRDEYGFGGVIMTDDLAAMGAITARFGVVEAAVRALDAGVDMVVLIDVDLDALLDEMEAAVGDGRLDSSAIDASVARTLALKGIDACTVRL